MGHPKHDPIPVAADAVAHFLRDLSDLSRRHGLALTGDITLFVMEPDDFGLSYQADAESAVSLG